MQDATRERLRSLARDMKDQINNFDCFEDSISNYTFAQIEAFYVMNTLRLAHLKQIQKELQLTAEEWEL